MSDVPPAIRRSLPDLALLAIAIGAVSTAAPLVRVADAPTLSIAFWRTFMALPVTGGVLLALHRDEVRHLDPETSGRSALAGVFLAGHFATWVPSLSFTSVASSVALVSTTPVWSALLAQRKGESVPASTWRGIAVALAGVVMLTGVDVSIESRALLGDLLALAGGVLGALYLNAGSDVRQRLSTATYTTLCYSVAAAGLLLVCLGGSQSLAGYDGKTWLAVAGTAAGPQLLGHTVFNRVLRTTGPMVVSMAILGEIIGAALLAWVFFGEVPPTAALPAGLLIGLGIVIVVRSRARVHSLARRGPA